jgi:nitric oxide reductase large subunit
MNPYINNNPFVASITNTKDTDNSIFIIVGGILLIGGAICMYHHKQKILNHMIVRLKAENEILKAQLIV